MKYSTKIDYKYPKKLCMKYCLQLNNYKHSDGVRLLVDIPQLQRAQNL